MDLDAEAWRVATCLGDRSRIIKASEFPGAARDADKPGLYSWWANRDALALIRATLSEEVDDFATLPRFEARSPIYVGQAGATKRGKTPKATLESRIRNNHISGSLKNSTFRLTLTAILVGPLKLSVVGPKKFAEGHNRMLSQWIRQHLSVAIVPWEDRDTLLCLERRALKRLTPPLNLNDIPEDPFRNAIMRLRDRNVLRPHGLKAR